ncbi:MAG: transcriptional regulator, LysR family [Ramlibacter sp.]|jgi:DNA-binding transcriptional LysR family regulator|nr:transcriptional regulator, LysR family [Ramlibacter sp.]
MTMIDIRQLRYFQAVAEELHFGRAAARLAIAQPALSRQVQQLEEELGTPLLRRTQRRVELLPAGALLLERSRAIQQELARAVADTRRTGTGELGRLSLGFIHSSTYGLLPSIVGRFRQLHPGIELELHELPITAQHAALLRGTIDLGLLRVQAAPADLEVLPVMPDPFLLALPTRHPLAGRSRVQVRSVAGDPFVMFSRAESPLFHARVQALCEQAGFTPLVAQHATQIHTVVGLVGAGLGVAVVPATARNLHPRNVRFVQLADKVEPVHVALAWRRGQETPAIQAFRKVTQEVVAALPRA